MRGFALRTSKVGVYWNDQCSLDVEYINWGELRPGSVREVTVYIRNEELASCYLFMWTEDWIPLEARNHVKMKWDYGNGTHLPMVPFGEKIPVNMNITILPSVYGINSFNFNITIVGTEYMIGDLPPEDGEVDINDAVAICGAYGTRPGDPKWLPSADVTNDGVVNIYDTILLVRNYGLKTA